MKKEGIQTRRRKSKKSSKSPKKQQQQQQKSLGVGVVDPSINFNSIQLNQHFTDDNKSNLSAEQKF